MKFPNPYESRHYKKMILVPLALMLISLFFIPSIPRGVDLKGGSLITVLTEEPAENMAARKLELESALSKIAPDTSVRQFENPSGRGFEIEVGASDVLDKAEGLLASLRASESALTNEMLVLQNLEANEVDKSKVDIQRQKVESLKTDFVAQGNSLLAQLKSDKTIIDYSQVVLVAEGEYQAASGKAREDILGAIRGVIAVKTYSSKEVGASLSRFFLSKTTEILLVSLIAAGLFVVLIFRGAVASIAVLFGAFADLIITAGVMGALGIPLSLATVAALLMLIGFSIDTDMLLTIRALKRTEGEAKDRVYDAMQTAFLMNSCAIAAFSVLLIVAMFLRIETYYQIGTVALIGGLVDFIATWLGNAVLVLWYAEIRKTR
ncbi:MAG: hypothetical protein AABX01_02120 [Candidatus Micrarchaeota archaeon]